MENLNAHAQKYGSIDFATKLVGTYRHIGLKTKFTYDELFERVKNLINQENRIEVLHSILNSLDGSDPLQKD